MTASPEGHKAKMTKHIVTIFIPICLILAVVMASIYEQELSGLERVSLALGDTHAEVLSDLLGNEFDVAISDLAYISRNHEMAKLLEEEASDMQDLLTDLVLFAQVNRRYDQIRFINLTGKEAVRINYNEGNPVIVSSQDLQNKSNRFYFKDSIKLKEGEVYISPMDLNIENGEIEQPLKPILRFGTPVYNDKGEKKGIVIINYRAGVMLDIVHAVDKQFIGNIELLDTDGYWLHSSDQAKEWGFMYPERKEIAYSTKSPELWKQISSIDRDRIRTSKSMLSFLTVRPVPDNPTAEVSLIAANDYRWKLLAEVPFSDISIQANPLRVTLLLLYAIFAAVTFVFAYFVANATEKKRIATEDREKLITELQKSLSEIKTLRGLIPICSMCKKVRDDTGFWHQVESYVHDHTDASFSHSYCPTCYDDIMKEISEGDPAEKKEL